MTLDTTIEGILAKRHIVRQTITTIIGKVEDFLPLAELPTSELTELRYRLTEYSDNLCKINREVEDIVGMKNVDAEVEVLFNFDALACVEKAEAEKKCSKQTIFVEIYLLLKQIEFA